MKRKSTKDILLEHSKAKVDLYVKYLSKYLNIIKRAGFYNKINLYDLMCGEGIYADKSEGSPIRALKTIRKHFDSNNSSCLDMEIWFNDFGESDVEAGKDKISRVEKACGKMFKPDNVEITYTNENFVDEILPKIKERLSKSKKEKSKKEKFLIFLDPYGYKDITPERIKDIVLINKKAVELLLFVPISFMYRFAEKSLKEEEDFKAGESLKSMLETLLDGEEKKFKNKTDFLETLKNKYRTYLNNNFFVDTFTIERDQSNIYALFFFTPHAKGFETMLQTKWEMDEENGKGFHLIKNQGYLFPDTQLSSYPTKLKEYIINKNANNRDLYLFGLNNGYLPKHTNEILKEWQNDPSFKVLDENGKEARKNSFYINYKHYSEKDKKIVTFKF